MNNIALRYLWARSRIATLGDFNLLRADDSRTKEITSLGLQYNLLTAYTSFVAIDSEIRNKDGKSQTVKQALPLPEGVSDYAVGGEAQSRGLMKGTMGLGFGGSMAPTSAPAPALFCKQRVMEVDALLDKSPEKKECEKSITHGKKKADIPIIDPAGVKAQGKTIMYFWTVSCTGCRDEIEAIIRFAAGNPGVNVLVVNIDKKDSQNARRSLAARFMLAQIPANVSFVFDPAAITCAKFGAPSNPHVLPVTLFWPTAAWSGACTVH